MSRPLLWGCSWRPACIVNSSYTIPPICGLSVRLNFCASIFWLTPGFLLTLFLQSYRNFSGGRWNDFPKVLYAAGLAIETNRAMLRMFPFQRRDLASLPFTSRLRQRYWACMKPMNVSWRLGKKGDTSVSGGMGSTSGNEWLASSCSPSLSSPLVTIFVVGLESDRIWYPWHVCPLANTGISVIRWGAISHCQIIFVTAYFCKRRDYFFPQTSVHLLQNYEILVKRCVGVTYWLGYISKRHKAWPLYFACVLSLTHYSLYELPSVSLLHSWLWKS